MTKDKPILIIAADFYPDIAAALIAGAQRELDRRRRRRDIVAVPGALEIPPALALAAAKPIWDGFVLLGCVIRGETSHYDIVAHQSARAVLDLAVAQRLAVGNGILTVDRKAQAACRADPDGDGDKGGAAARACLALIELRHRLDDDKTLGQMTSRDKVF